MKAFRHIYIHVPFCDVICHYCHFYTARSKEAHQEEFFHALENDLVAQRPLLSDRIEAVYFGGGTPAASPPELLMKFLDTLSPQLTRETEITLEANPANLTPEKVASWKRAGINRISLGVQSLNDSALKRLGRAHSAEQARKAAALAAAEIPNLSCDLMFAVPEQSEDEPSVHAIELLKLGAKHLSFYHLTLEKEHFLHPSLPSDAFAWSQLKRAAEALEPLGLHHYEVASFAEPGRESRNNGNYWNSGPYLALGPSAHGFDGQNERWSNVSDWREYIRRIQAGESPRAWTEKLTPAQRRIEVLFTSLRTSEGLDLQTFLQQFGEDILRTHSAPLRRWEEEGLLKITNGRLVLTFSGKMLSDEIARALL